MNDELQQAEGSESGEGADESPRIPRYLWLVGAFLLLGLLLWPQIKYRFSAPVRVGMFARYVVDGNGERAWDYLSEEDREEFSREEFSGLVDLVLISISGGGGEAAAVRTVAGREGSEKLSDVLRERSRVTGLRQELEDDRGEVIVSIRTVDISDIMGKGLEASLENLLSEGELGLPGDEELAEIAREAPLTDREVGFPVVWERGNWMIRLPDRFDKLKPLLELYGDT